MKTINKILVPLDFTEHSKGVLIQAIDIAQKARAELIVLHVHSRPTVSKSLEQYADMDLIRAMEKSKLSRLKDKIKTKYDQILTETPGHENIKIKFLFEKGTVVDKILDVSEQHNVNLILMGTRGVRGLQEFWGTKTAEICLKTKTPVLVLPYNRMQEKPDKIAFAYDLKTIPNLQTLDLVKLFSALYQSEIHIITVYSQKYMNVEESDNLEKLRDHFKEYSPIVKTQYGGDAEKGIFNYLKENQIQLLVILHRHRSFLQDIFHESLTAKITYHSNIPVLALDERENPSE